jgi:hypothetical protein
VPELWVPGVEGPHDEFVEKLLRAIAAQGEHVVVTMELRDGTRYELISISPEPGYGFITLRPHPEGEGPTEVIVPIGAIAQIRLHAPEERPQFGFSLPPGG